MINYKLSIMARQKYPKGLQDFGEIRINDFIYIFKTSHILTLLQIAKYYLKSCRWRFGKSLLISTLDCVIRGQKELFEGLYIYVIWDFAKTIDDDFGHLFIPPVR